MFPFRTCHSIQHNLKEASLHIIKEMYKTFVGNTPDYKNYGGRGICVEESFDTIDKFYTWAINNGYEKGLEVDREDNDGNYSDTNCRWVTKAENTRNRRASVMSWELVEKNT